MYTLGAGVTLEYDGGDLTAGDAFFSVKAGTPRSYSMELKNTDTNTVKESVSFNAGEAATFRNGVTIQTKGTVNTGDVATFAVENTTVDAFLTNANWCKCWAKFLCRYYIAICVLAH